MQQECATNATRCTEDRGAKGGGCGRQNHQSADCEDYLSHPDSFQARPSNSRCSRGAQTHHQRQNQGEQEHPGQVSSFEQCQLTHNNSLSPESDKADEISSRLRSVACVERSRKAFEQSISAPLIIVSIGRVVKPGERLGWRCGLPMNLDVADVAIHKTDDVSCVVEKATAEIDNRSFRLMPRVRDEGRVFRHENGSSRMLDRTQFHPANARPVLRWFIPLNV